MARSIARALGLELGAFRAELFEALCEADAERSTSVARTLAEHASTMAARGLHAWAPVVFVAASRASVLAGDHQEGLALLEASRVLDGAVVPRTRAAVPARAAEAFSAAVRHGGALAIRLGQAARRLAQVGGR